MRPILRRLLALFVCGFSVASCDWAMMAESVRLRNGAIVTLQHRSDGTFRSIVANDDGNVSRDYTGAADSRHVSLYLSPRGRVIVADYGVMPMIVEFPEGRPPIEATASAVRAEYKLSPDWRYIGSVRRTDGNALQYYPYDPECQAFRDGHPLRVLRDAKPCQDANYIGL